MDRGSFDTLARLVSTRRSRRSALATVLGAALLQRNLQVSLGRNNEKVRRQAVTRCYPGTRCVPGRGRNTSGCDFANSTAFVNGDFRGSNLSNSNFTGAQLAQADFRGANLSGSCFVGANLRDAKLGASVNLHNAILCKTLMPDGSISDRDCAKGTECCPTGCKPGECPGEICVAFDNLCNIPFGTACCPFTTCAVSLLIAVTSCQSPCSTNQECADRFENQDLVCGKNGRRCTFIGNCCIYKDCKTDADCPRTKRCCQNTGTCCT